jgi:phosphoglycolate phosphatase-like HAD superfamily hydrolase
VTEVAACPGVRDMLRAAREAGVRIGAATSHGEIAEACLVTTGLYPLIDCLVTQEEVARPKPQPDALLRVLTLLAEPGRDPRHTALCVGDTPEDIEAGRAAGVRTVAVTYGMSDEREMRSARPDLIIHSFGEMQAWLGRQGARPVSRETSCPTFWG